MRTREEIHALAKTFSHRFVPEGDPDRVETWKGEPPVFVCAEPLGSIHFPGPDGDTTRCPCLVVGPVSLLAMAWHLRLTPEEMADSGLHPENGWALLENYINRVTDAAGLERLPLRRIEPDDPCWGRP